jgi:hypothetical protein
MGNCALLKSDKHDKVEKIKNDEPNDGQKYKTLHASGDIENKIGSKSTTDKDSGISNHY